MIPSYEAEIIIAPISQNRCGEERGLVPGTHVARALWEAHQPLPPWPLLPALTSKGRPEEKAETKQLALEFLFILSSEGFQRLQLLCRRPLFSDHSQGHLTRGSLPRLGFLLPTTEPVHLPDAIAPP